MADRDARLRISVEAEGKASVAEVANELKSLEEQLGEIDGEQIRIDIEGGDSIQVYRSELEEALGEIQQRVEQFGEAAQESIATGLDFKHAADSVKQFSEAGQKGFQGLEEKAAQARYNLNALKTQVESLKSSGRGLTDAHVAELKDLEEEYEEAIKAAGRFKAAQEESRRELDSAAKAADNASGPIGGLDDIFDRLGGRSSQIALKLGAVVGAFKAGYEAGTAFREGLGAIDEALGTSLQRGLDETVTRLFRLNEAAEAWVGTAPNAQRQAQNLQNVMRQLAANGLKPASDKYEELVKQLEDFRRAQGNAIMDFQAAEKALGVSVGEITKAVAEFSKFVAKYRQSTDAIADVNLAAILKPQIQEFLDQYKRLGVEVPPQLQALAREWGVVDSATEKSLEKVKAFSKSYKEELDRAAQGTKNFADTSTESIAGLQVALEKFQLPENFHLLPPEKQEELRTTLRGMIDALREHGGAYTEEIQHLVTYTGLLIPPWDDVKKGLSDGAKALDQVAKSSAGTSKAAKDTEVSWDKMAASLKAAVGELDESADKAGKAAPKLKDAGDKAGEGAKGLQEQADAAGDAKTQLGDVATQSDAVATAQERAATAVRSLRTDIDPMATSIETLATVLEKINWDAFSNDAITRVSNVEKALDALLAKILAVETAVSKLEGGGEAAAA